MNIETGNVAVPSLDQYNALDAEDFLTAGAVNVTDNKNTASFSVKKPSLSHIRPRNSNNNDGTLLDAWLKSSPAVAAAEEEEDHKTNVDKSIETAESTGPSIKSNKGTGSKMDGHGWNTGSQYAKVPPSKNVAW